MIRPVIAIVVGTIIIYVYQAFSWMVLPVHNDTFKYSARQDTLLDQLDKHLEEPGAYRFPAADNHTEAASKGDDHKKMNEVSGEHQGPYAQVFYVARGFEMNPVKFAVGFLSQLFSVFFVVLVLSAVRDRLTTFFQRLWLVMLLAGLIILQGPVANLNWMDFPWHYVKGTILDILIGWFLAGVWLAYFIKPVEK